MKIKISKIISLIIILFIISSSVLIPLIFNLDPNIHDLSNRYAKPSPEHFFGTDELGRDIFSRTLYGTKITIGISILASLVSIFLSLIIGYIKVFSNKIIREIFETITDIMMCIPFFVLAASLTGILGASVINLILVIALFTWPQSSRLIKVEIQKLYDENYIRYQRLCKKSNLNIFFCSMLPNMWHIIISRFTICLSQSILMESTLSFLSLGIRPPNASLGTILSSAMNIININNRYYIYLPAAIIIIVSIMCTKIIADR